MSLSYIIINISEYSNSQFRLKFDLQFVEIQVLSCVNSGWCLGMEIAPQKVDPNNKWIMNE
jgi:hypothetical protein